MGYARSSTDDDVASWRMTLVVFLAYILLLLGTLYVVFSESEEIVRRSGGILQLVGVVTVWCDLVNTAGIFDIERYLQRVRKAFERAFSGSADHSMSGAATVSVTSDAEFTWRVDATAPLEERVAKAEKAIDDLIRGQIEARRETKRVGDELKADYESKIEAIREGLSKVVSDVKQTATGNYDMLTLGAISLFIGVALSSFTPETLRLGQWFRALGS